MVQLRIYKKELIVKIKMKLMRDREITSHNDVDINILKSLIDKQFEGTNESINVNISNESNIVNRLTRQYKQTKNNSIPQYQTNLIVQVKLKLLKIYKSNDIDIELIKELIKHEFSSVVNVTNKFNYRKEATKIYKQYIIFHELKKQRSINNMNKSDILNQINFNKKLSQIRFDLMNENNRYTINISSIPPNNGGSKKYIQLQKGGKRVIHTGSKGGKYYMKGGRKVYI